MPLPFLPDVEDDVLFDGLHLVMIGYLLLAFAPRWEWTPSIVNGLVFGYSVMYALILGVRLQAHFVSNPLPEGGGFDSLKAVVALFSDRAAVFAGWTHYIAFDLFVAGHIVSDAHINGIPHLVIVWLVPVTLMAGPFGLAAYFITKTVWLALFKKGSKSRQD
jgi:hypothetical protein